MATRQEQIMIHLYGQIHLGNEYAMPYETTQDGIAKAIGISRGQVSIEMRRLEAKGLVTHLLRHAYAEDYSSRVHRMCYKLKVSGIATVHNILKASNGVA